MSETKFEPKTPLLAVDVVIVYDDESLVAIERKYPPLGLALPGGFVDIGETTTVAAVREAKEETGLDVGIVELVGVFDKPTRDPRRHVVSIAYRARPLDQNVKPVAGDDAKNIVIVKPGENILWAFDHKEIVRRALYL